MIMVRPTNSRHLLLLPLLVFLWLQSLDSSNALLPSQTVARKRHVVHLTFPITSTSVKSFKNGSDQEADPTAMQASITEIDSDEPEVLPTFLLERNPPPIMSNTELMAAMGTSPRRILLSLASTTGIALAANFLGVTSHLLEVIPESAVEASGLDTYFPRGNYKRYKGQGYTFVMPKEWVADTGLELAKAQRRAKMLDYEIKQSSGNAVLPDAAFGPPGRLDSRGVSKGDTNVSVIVSKGLPGFSLRGTLGTPTNAAETLLKVSLAPEGSGRIATLVNAEEDTERQVYQFEYDIDRGERGPPLKAISVIAERNGDTLMTLTVVAPRQDWATEGTKLRKVASSFHLT